MSLKISERWEQDIDPQEVEERDPDEGYQFHDKEKEFTHDSVKEDLVEGQEPEEREILICASPSDEAIQGPIPLAQDEENEVNHFPFQVFDDALFYDLEGEEMLEDPFDVLNPSCYDKSNDVIDNIDESIHVGRRKWDVIGSDENPIYDMEGHFHLLSLQQSYDVRNNFDVWQQDDDIITDVSQAPKGDLALCSPNNFWSYLEDFDEYSFEHLDLFYEEDNQPSLCSDLDKGEDVACLKQGTCDKASQLTSTTLPRYVTKGVVVKHVPCPKFSLGQSLPLEFKGRLNTLRRSLLSQSFSFPLKNCQSS
jgi:hypothetical protein